MLMARDGIQMSLPPQDAAATGPIVNTSRDCADLSKQHAYQGKYTDHLLIATSIAVEFVLQRKQGPAGAVAPPGPQR
ncbi:hypothetical protein GCM10009662_43420 [Catellatospora coxensis]|uniref:Uncharacterized protein n=1 Tax=Catellatospora coxensis TaxID=310354 RepID=A0A8J3KYG1_9ACTN|nr:hypothetical protein Cco03nite_24240 [Catellatospora coxensis]